LSPRGARSNWFRVISSCLPVLLSPLWCVAQLPPDANPLPLPDHAASQVSARELQIPPKARKAFGKGIELLAAKESAASIVEFQRAIKIFPELYEAYYEIGLANLNLRRNPDAQAAFETSLRLSKGRYPPSQFGLGVVLCFQKQFTEAEEAIRSGLDQYPADAAGHFILAWVLFTAGRLPDAENNARQAILANPNLATAYLLLAEIHLRQSDLLALLSDLDAYLKLEPEAPQNAQAKAIRTQAEHLLAKQRGAAPVVAKAPVP
jgi:tetratricopeptide (TPR) repeat protein